MASTILFVDDEPRVLDGIRRTLRSGFDAEFAEGGHAGLEVLRQHDVAVIVSDMMMPGMNGPQFLAKAGELRPDAVQMILSGQADLTSTVAAVNDGNLFRFLVKPTPPESLIAAVDAALEHYRLRRAERDLLEQTLTGAIDALGEILALANPQSARRATLIRQYVTQIAASTDFQGDWQLQIAAMVSSTGMVAMPDDVVERVCSPAALSVTDLQMVRTHPETAARVVGHIPRLETVADLVLSQFTSIRAVPADVAYDRIHVMQLATDVADRVLRGVPEQQAIELARETGSYPSVLFAGLVADTTPTMLRELKPIDLRPGMILENDLLTKGGALIAIAGTSLTVPMLERIKNFATGSGVREPIVVRVKRRVAA